MNILNGMANAKGEKLIVEIDVRACYITISYQGKYHYRRDSTKQELKKKFLNEFLVNKLGKT
ncbi:MAG: hypothetical protein PHW82_05835 [Bacteroidales bacterium]|nr:hypothetical protein [Bacteroidales bacterium]